MVGVSFPTVTKEDIFRNVSEAEVLVSVFPDITGIPCLIQSPLREDNNPSFSVYANRKGHICFNDFATGEKGSLTDLLCLYWKCPYNQVLQRLNTMSLKKKEKSIVMRQAAPRLERVIRKHSPVTLKVKIRAWKKHDIEYWESYGISLKWLKYAEVYPISHIFFVSKEKTTVFPAEKYAYTFIERKEGNITLKVYQPLTKNKRHKWFNSNDKSVISLWNKIPDKGDMVVICSSLKDALCLSANAGIPAIAPQGEGYGMSNTAVENLKNRFSNIYILYDNDKAGIENSRKLSEKTGFPYVILPPFMGGKDVSDLYKAVGKETFVKTINQLFGLGSSGSEDNFSELPF